MSAADSSDVDVALVAKLRGDSDLHALMPDGVWFDDAPPGLEHFVIVSLVDHHDVSRFGGRAYEDATYLVKAVALSSSTASVKNAAARIDQLLDDSTLTVTGYELLAMFRTSRVRATEVDEIDTAIRWQHRGGHYRVQVAPV